MERTFRFRLPSSPPKKHPTALAMGCFFGGPCVLWRETPLRRSEAKRADCHDCTASVREPTDTRRNECAVGTLKKFANLSPHISVQIPLWSTKKSSRNLTVSGLLLVFSPFLKFRRCNCTTIVLFRTVQTPVCVPGYLFRIFFLYSNGLYPVDLQNTFRK